MKKLGIFETLLSIIILLGITSLLYLYTSGYRLQRGSNATNNTTVDITQTGMINAKSLPDGATVYLDDEVKTATNGTIAGIEPGIHKLKIVKKGFVSWEKEVEVFKELVTDITAVLVSQTPRLEPLTNTGARVPSISPSLSKLAYFSTETENPGIWIIPLSDSGLSLFRSNPTVAIQDTRFTKYSEGLSIEWNPEETELLVLGPQEQYYLVDLTNNVAKSIYDPEEVRQAWQKTLTDKRTAFVEKLEIPESIKGLAVSPRTKWAPDEKKFLYTTQEGDSLEYRVYNLENPLPVGEKAETVVLKTIVNDAQPVISWYTDSFHLILVEGNLPTDKTGRVSLVRIDGSNKVEIYNNTLLENKAFSAPGGDKIIILTSFKSEGQTDLYTVGIR